MSQFTLETCMMFTTNVCTKQLQSVLSKRLKQANITYNTWLTLYFIQLDKKITQSHLAKLIGITNPSMVKIIKNLAEQNYIHEEQSTDDHRQKYISLTPKGIKKYNDTLKIVKDFQEATTAGLSKNELDIAASVIQKMMQNTRE